MDEKTAFISLVNNSFRFDSGDHNEKLDFYKKMDTLSGIVPSRYLNLTGDFYHPKMGDELLSIITSDLT
jgi:hypothetical protein